MEWDKISWFQIHQVAVFGIFLLLFRVLPLALAGRAIVSLGMAIVLGAIPFLYGRVSEIVAEQIRSCVEVASWTRAEVSEFRSPFFDAGWTFDAALERFTILVFALPVLLVLVATNRRLAFSSRLALVAGTAGTFALASLEVKLGHFYSVTFPFLLCAGVLGLLTKRRAMSLVTWIALLAIAVPATLWSLPKPRGTSTLDRPTDEAILQICSFLAWKKAQAEGVSVLEGIRDSHRFFLSTEEDTTSATKILAERRVRYVVAWYNRLFLATAPRILGQSDVLAERKGNDLRFTSEAKKTLFWRLRYGIVPGFKLLHEGMQINLGSGPEPIFKIFEVKESP
jgi:hypothetical protein